MPTGSSWKILIYSASDEQEKIVATFDIAPGIEKLTRGSQL